VPGPWSVGIARALEAVLRGALFRSGYDVLYTAVPAAEKRATKTLVDVGIDRVGDIVGAGVIALVLLATPGDPSPALLACCGAFAVAMFLVVARVRRGYVVSLEQGLRRGVLDAGALSPTEMTTRVTLERSADALLAGLGDAKFDVRHASGRALARMHRRGVAIDPALVWAAVIREAGRERAVWRSQRLIEQIGDDGDEPLVDDFLRARAGRSLEHVFTLLGLVLPREPLRTAFQGLLAGDPALRGTALEYLEIVLPAPVREVLWPHLEPERAERRARGAVPPSREQVLAELLDSNASIQVAVEKLRRES
jgi:hypothetical protein